MSMISVRQEILVRAVNLFDPSAPQQVDCEIQDQCIGLTRAEFEVQTLTGQWRSCCPRCLPWAVRSESETAVSE